MSKYLIRVTETYRCDTEAEAKELIDSSKGSHQYTVVKSTNEIKSLKQKGEIVDEWHRVTLTKDFTSEKEPIVQLYPAYQEKEEEDE